MFETDMKEIKKKKVESLLRCSTIKFRKALIANNIWGDFGNTFKEDKGVFCHVLKYVSVLIKSL